MTYPTPPKQTWMVCAEDLHTGLACGKCAKCRRQAELLIMVIAKARDLRMRATNHQKAFNPLLADIDDDNDAIIGQLHALLDEYKDA